MRSRCLLASLMLLAVTLAACASPPPTPEPKSAPAAEPTLIYFHATW